MKMLVVVAHPDDETFGTGSVIARAARDGADVVVLCATSGELGEARPGSVPCGCSLAEVRRQELHAAGQDDAARHVAARLREFRKAEAAAFFAACVGAAAGVAASAAAGAGDAAAASAPAFPCQPPAQPVAWRWFVHGAAVQGR